MAIDVTKCDTGRHDVEQRYLWRSDGGNRVKMEGYNLSRREGLMLSETSGDMKRLSVPLDLPPYPPF